jgi:tRNA-specific 2-thiouridylase
VLEYFSTSYFTGRTPNPCVICNREIKFGLFLEAILAGGMTHMATGHYARLEQSGNIHRLFMGIDPRKDQSYFLSRLDQNQLARILFPLGGRTKESTYRLVEQHGFDDFQGLESQDVCFLADTTIGDFLEGRSPRQNVAGPILSTAGEILGTHQGLFRYTIGQRRGLGIASDAPLYVVELDVERNAVIVGRNEELFRRRIRVTDLHWLAGTPPDTAGQYTVRIRYSHRGSAAALALHDDRYGEILFHEPQRAITPGQFAVIYDGTELLGSGIISAGEES